MRFVLQLLLVIGLTVGFSSAHAGVVGQAENWGTTIGEVVEDADAVEGSAMRVARESNVTGTLAFGSLPEALETGSLYEASFRMKSSHVEGEVDSIIIDVFNPITRKRLNYRVVGAPDFNTAGVYQDFTVNFTQIDNDPYEFRVFYKGESDFDLFLDQVNVEKTGSLLVSSYDASQMATGIGEYVEDTANNGDTVTVLKSTSSEEGGTLQFGPSESNLENEKRYNAIFHLKVSDNSSTENGIYIDVYNHETNHREYRVLSASDFHTAGVYQSFEIPFTRYSQGYEYRVFHYPYAEFDLYSSYTDVYAYSEILDVQPEDLGTEIGEIIYDEDASAYSAIYVDKNSNQNGGIVQFGPYERALEADKNYFARFRMKVSDNSVNEHKIYIDVYSHDANYRNYLLIKPSDFNAANVYQNFEIPFIREGEGYEFRAFYFPDSNFDLYSDSVKIFR